MSVTVQRLPGDKIGDAIVSSVLTTVASQVERGTYEVNTQDRDRKTVSGEVISSEFLQPGTMHGVDIKGELKNGLLKSFKYSLSATANSTKVSTSVVLETIK
jgi:hypothetical protein